MNDNSFTPTKLKDGYKNFIISIDECLGYQPNQRTRGKAGIANLRTVNGAREWINKIILNGDFVCLFSSQPEKSRKSVEKWLKENGFKHHTLVMEKPVASSYHYIDDRHVRATTFTGRYTKLVKTEKTIRVFS